MEKRSPNQSQKQVSKRRRKWPWVLGGVLLLIILLVLLIPVVLSSEPCTQWIATTISRATGGEAQIGNLSVGWLKGVHAVGLRFRGQDGWAQVDIGRIRSQPRFAGLLSGTLALDRTVIDDPRIAIDLRERPTPAEDRPPIDLDNLSRLNDIIVNNASLEVTDLRGETVKIASLDSQLSLRPAGRTSSFAAEATVAQADQPGRIEASGQITPKKETGWSFKGTTGDVVVEVNDLNLGSLAPLLGLAGIQVQAKGELSGNMTGQIRDGRIESLDANIAARNLDVAGEVLKGDRLQTSELSIRTALTQAQQTISVDQLDVQTDWATLSATGKVPMTAGSLAKLLENGEPYDLKGRFDIDLATLVSQIPNTIGVREGMQITGGRATGTISTATQAGRPTLAAEANVTGLAGVVDGEQLALSEPVLANLRLARGEKGAELEKLSVSAPFATVDAAGSFDEIDYQGQIDLASLQSELGSFVDLGIYQIAGQVASKGRLSIQEGLVSTSGTLSARQLVLASPDGNSVSEPTANIDFSLGIDQERQVLTIDALKAVGGFGTIDLAKATVPLAEDAPAPMDLRISADQVSLSRLKPYMVLFASFPQQLQIDGTARSQVAVTRQDGVYHISTDATTIQDFTLAMPDEPPFEQEQVTALFDVYVDPNININVDRLQVEGPQIRIEKGQFKRTSQGDTTKLEGVLEAQLDWATAGRVASAFVPGDLAMAGQRQVAVNFASTYPTDDPNGLLANLNSEASLGFDRAQYMGLDFGPTDINIQVEDGLMQIEPFSAPVNNGQFRFAGEANLSRRPILLTTPASLKMAEGVQITQEMSDTLLKYVNPIFANAVSVNGIVNFDAQNMTIPLTGGQANQAKLAGTVSMPEVRLRASLLSDILSVARKSVREEVLAIAPTNIAFENSTIRYEDMQIVAGDNPINFGGAIGLDGRLDMTVVLPYTYEGRTARVGEPTGQRGERIALPLTGRLGSPQLDLGKVLELQLQQQLQRGLQRLFD